MNYAAKGLTGGKLHCFVHVGDILENEGCIERSGMDALMIEHYG